MHEKFVSHFADLILQHKRVLLQAPVGSGKTRFVNNILALKGRVLLITSRKCIRNMAFFAVKRAGRQDQVTTVFQWNVRDWKYDLNEYQYVVVDECHLFMSDSWADAAWHLEKFIRALPEHLSIIMMSACAERVRRHIEKSVVPGIQFVDLDGKVHKAMPKKAFTIKANQAQARLLHANAHNRILYYVDTTKQGYELEEQIRAKLGEEIGAHFIAITAQPENRTDAIKHFEEKEQKVQDYLDRYGKFPPDIWAIITTSKNREGLNIEYKPDEADWEYRVRQVITELKDFTSLVQCSGRVRHGVEEFLVVSNRGNRIPFFNRSQAIKAERFVQQLNIWADNIINEDDVKDEFHSYLIEVANHYKDLVIFDENRFHLNTGLVSEIDARFDEYGMYRENLDDFLAETVEVEDLTGMAMEILQSYDGQKFTSDARDKIIHQLNELGFPGKQLSKMVSQFGYRQESTADRRYYWLVAVGNAPVEEQIPVNPESQTTQQACVLPTYPQIPYIPHHLAKNACLEIKPSQGPLDTDAPSSHRGAFAG